MKFETLAIHGGNLVTDSQKPVIQPITLSTTFEHQGGSMLYSRINNPNRLALENLMAKIEMGSEGAAFSSGNAAAMSVFQALPHGSHVIAPDDMYHGLRAQLEEIFEDKLEITFTDLANQENFKDNIQPNTKLLWMETPSNPLLKICPINVLTAIAKFNNIATVCDNTFATPVFQHPLKLGADMVMHSATKYLGGHSDILGGILVTKEPNELWGKIRKVQRIGGAVMAPWDCYLLTRSLKTLAYRMKGHAEHAGIIASFLDQHPKVEKVYYPGLVNHEGHTIALQQMSGFGGILSFLIKGGAKEANRVISRLKYFTNATSLGGVESLIERRAAVEGPNTPTPPNLIRVSVGLEHLEDLLEDWEQALS
ncbi:aminotransferase class I/II-fold pyridoxal phosphate-dependent enzyme [Echinicola jeungdonensis]|uniref:Trans-sulfuration enzyme family protein n=1 Tax=Echinicola jeungdonensis TaxID=709343 RepID=A0ABV5J598_9BACT|nr:aminotransferase class I/II-fold pyridoxal phosphate-dependent enzyme [Echinicola jeungdonensis]MDN3668685.1 aminotransferase class I/II-fold pyridoxal phosphate-dependent enzyme [Echinicola jeungdonensis]